MVTPSNLRQSEDSMVFPWKCNGVLLSVLLCFKVIVWYLLRFPCSRLLAYHSEALLAFLIRLVSAIFRFPAVSYIWWSSAYIERCESISFARSLACTCEVNISNHSWGIDAPVRRSCYGSIAAIANMLELTVGYSITIWNCAFILYHIVYVHKQHTACALCASLPCGGSYVVFECRLKLISAFFDNPEFVWGGLSSFPEITVCKT